MKMPILAVLTLISLAVLGIILGQAATSNLGAAISVGVIVGVAASIPTSLIIALAGRNIRERRIHHHQIDQRQVVVYMLQNPDGSVEELGRIQGPPASHLSIRSVEAHNAQAH